MLFCDFRIVRLRRQHQPQNRQQTQQQAQQQAQQQNQQPKQQQNLIEFGLPAQIYGVGFSILMVFGHKKMIIIMMMMGFLVCVFATKNFRLRRQHR